MDKLSITVPKDKVKGEENAGPPLEKKLFQGRQAGSKGNQDSWNCPVYSW